MNIEEYVEKNSLKERQKHIDLETPCINPNRRTSMSRALCREMLWKFLGLTKDNNKQNVHSCHMCENDNSTPNGFICINPKHIYVGTPKENSNDFWSKKKPV
jgi:hypothetical protein